MQEYQDYPATKSVSKAIRMSVQSAKPVVYLGSGLDLLPRCEAGDGEGWYWGTDAKTNSPWLVFAVR